MTRDERIMYQALQQIAGIGRGTMARLFYRHAVEIAENALRCVDAPGRSIDSVSPGRLALPLFSEVVDDPVY